MKKNTLSRKEFVEEFEELLNRFQKAGGDPAFVILAWVPSLGAGMMDAFGATMSDQRSRLRKQGASLAAGARALKNMRTAVAQLKKLGYDGDGLVDEDELASLSKDHDLALSHYKRDRTAVKRLGPRPERMRYMMTSALISYLESRKIGTVAWRWTFIGDWTALVDNVPKYLHDADSFRRFIGALGSTKRRLDRLQLKKTLNAALPETVVVGEPLDLKRWWETRALKSRDSLSKDARLVGMKAAATWSRR